MNNYGIRGRALHDFRACLEFFGAGMHEVASGSGRRENELISLVYDELRGVAAGFLRRQSPDFTVRATDLVHEACMNLLERGEVDWTSTGHFRAIAIHKIRQVILDHLDRRRALKRGGAGIGDGRAAGGAAARSAARRVPLTSIKFEWREREVDLLDLSAALADLEAESQRLHDTIMLHWFGGMTHAEVAEALGVSPSTTEKDHRYAIAWLNRRLFQGCAA